MKMKRLAVVFVTVAMLFGMAVPAYADPGKYARYEENTINEAYWEYDDGKIKAKWTADDRSKASYTLILYVNGRKVTKETTKGGSLDLTKVIAKEGNRGTYSYILQAKWPGNFTDEVESEEIEIDRDMMDEIKDRADSLKSKSSSSSKSSKSSRSSGGSGAGPASEAGPSAAFAGEWQQTGGIWRYLKPDRTYAAGGWEFINGRWYCFDAAGNMLASQWIQKVDNPHIWYYVGPDGDMLTSQYIGEWYVNEAGECYY